MKKQKLAVIALSTLLIAGVVGCNSAKTVETPTTAVSTETETTTEAEVETTISEEVTVAGVVEETTGAVVAEGKEYSVQDLDEPKTVKIVEETSLFELYDFEGNKIKDAMVGDTFTVTGCVYYGSEAYEDWYFAKDSDGNEGYISALYFEVVTNTASTGTTTGNKGTTTNSGYASLTPEQRAALEALGLTTSTGETTANPYTGQPYEGEVTVTLE